MSDNFENFLTQGVAIANNYWHTGRPNKAIKMIHAVKSTDSDNKLAELLMQKICCDQFCISPPDLSEHFGDHWLGQNLDGKSIEIFCDQGMGDTINLLRYVKELKKEYDCKIFLNCYAFYNELERLIETQCEYIDFFTPFHVRCDYHTNIMSLPTIINGIELDVYYPVHFDLVLNTPLPSQINFDRVASYKLEGKKNIGIVWQTNSDNPLSEQKSINLQQLDVFKDVKANFYCLQPLKFESNWISPLPIEDLHDTVAFIKSCDCIVSVDTAVLHLAGVLGKKTFALLSHDADPRWGSDNKTIWYPNIEIHRQDADKDWSPVLTKTKESLIEFLN